MADSREGPRAAKAVFAQWHPAPPKPPRLDQRLQGVRWERSLRVASWLVYPVALGASVAISHFFMRHNTPLLFFGVFGGVPALAKALSARAGYGRAHDSLRDLMDLPAAVPQFPVEAVFSSEGAEYGRDHGVVTFVEGQLHFEGFRARFSLPSASLSNQRITSFGSKQVSYESYYLEWEGGGIRGTVRLTPYDKVEGVGSDLRAQFDRLFCPWLADKSKEAEAILPPIKPQPGKLRKVKILIALEAVGIVLSAGLFLYGLSQFKAQFLLFAAPIIVLVPMVREQIGWWRTLKKLTSLPGSSTAGPDLFESPARIAGLSPAAIPAEMSVEEHA